MGVYLVPQSKHECAASRANPHNAELNTQTANSQIIWCVACVGDARSELFVSRFACQGKAAIVWDATWSLHY